MLVISMCVYVCIFSLVSSLLPQSFYIFFLLLCLLPHFISYIYRNCNRRKIKKTFELLTSFLVFSDFTACVLLCMSSVYVYVCACVISCIFHFSFFTFCFSFTHENKWFMHASPPLTRYSIEILPIIDSAEVALIALSSCLFRYFFNSDFFN